MFVFVFLIVCLKFILFRDNLFFFLFLSIFLHPLYLKTRYYYDEWYININILLLARFWWNNKCVCSKQLCRFLLINVIRKVCLVFLFALSVSLPLCIYLHTYIDGGKMEWNDNWMIDIYLYIKLNICDVHCTAKDCDS